MFDHVTVLLKEAVEGLNIKADGIYVDCTLGGAGHSCAILKQLTTGHLYCFDQDQTAIEAARLRLDAVGNNYTIIYSNFVNIKEKLNEFSENGKKIVKKYYTKESFIGQYRELYEELGD